MSLPLAVTASRPAAPHGADAWRATLAGFCATFVGLGLARFAYTPLLPAIVQAGWFDAAGAAYLGAANLAGYLAGALAAGPAARRRPAAEVLRAMMLVAAASLLACAWPGGFAWFFGWRFLAGLAGGACMVLAAPTVLPHVAPKRRGLAGGAIFMGVGVGIAASGLVVPLLLRRGPGPAWIGLGLLALVATAIAWRGWPKADAPAPALRPPVAALPVSGAVLAVCAAYALNSVGLVPHMIFLVDFVARGLGQGLASGAAHWVYFGAGAVLGPVAGGFVADRIGFRGALRLAFVAQAIAVLLPALGLAGGWLVVSSVVMGAFTPGIVSLVLGRLNELLPHDLAAQKAAWSRATTGFAVFQAAAAYGLSFLLVHSGGRHALLFALGGAAIVAGLLLDLASSRRARAA